MKDAIVEEIRRIRHQIEQKFGHDPQKYLDPIYEAEKQHGEELVRNQRKPLRKRRAM